LYGREQRGGSAALSMRQLLGLAYWRLPVCAGAFAQHSAPVSAHRLGPFSNSASLATALAGSLALFALHCAFVICYPRCVGFRSMAARWASAHLPGFSLASQEHGVGAGVLAYPGPSPNFGFKKLLPT